MCILSDYVVPRSTGRRASVRDVVDHIDHVVALVGEEYVGIGTDFDGGGGVIDCNDVSELPNLTYEMMRRGYSEQTLRKIWGENFLRVFSRVEANAAVELKGRSDE
ncbi:fused gamma-glutamyl-gamma-aminobutyrate hydrolase/peptidase, partial [bacterium]|nr:fused gamma-glutamyl-gamma-aminobutyrate hydrolase/peptidase [bacterium]